MSAPSAHPDCPVCGAPASLPPLNAYSLRAAAEHFCPPGRSPERTERMEAAIRQLWGREEALFLRCRACGFGYCDPYVSGDEAFYSILNESYGYSNWKWDYSFGQQELAKAGGGKVIDIGAGSGLFLDKLGPSWETYATEGSESTRNALRAKGIRVPQEAELGQEAFRGFFDAVTMFQLLELIVDFRGLLGAAYGWLKPGGLLVIAVPHADRIVYQEQQLGCPDMPPHHPNKWTPESLSRVLRELGFEVYRIENEPISLENLRNSLHLKMIANAQDPRSLAARVRGVGQRSLRIALMGLLSAWYLLRYAPQLGAFFTGRHFALAARKPA